MKSKKIKTKNYPAHYLALFLMTALLLQGFLMSSTSKSDWMSAAPLLDVSETVAAVVEDTSRVFAPVTETVAAVNKFYSLAANEAIVLLDMKDSFRDVNLAIEGVFAFYEEASIQMTYVLDVSSVSALPAVAGAYIER